MEDELYWNLTPGDNGDVSILGETAAPQRGPNADTSKWPAFWTVEHPAKEEGISPGRVFCCVISHPDEVAFSSSFQMIMMRAFAWCLGEPSDPFLREIDPGEHDA